MASLAKNFGARSNKSSLDDSGHGRTNLSERLRPLQVDTRFHNKTFVDNTEVKIDHADVAAGKEERTKQKSLRSPTSERKIAERLEDLSQLESPLLRELAHRLRRRLNIETPRCERTFRHPYADLDVGERWKEIQGCNGWAGLLGHDFDKVLKAEILRYGEFAQAAYDGFDGDKTSKHCGTCKYTKSELLKKVGLENRGYEITTFLYATTDISWSTRKDSKHSNESVKHSNEDSKHNDDGGMPSKENGKKDREQSRENSDTGHQKCKECNHGRLSRMGNASSNRANRNCKNCTENSKQCNWIGFVAVCTSNDEIARLGRRDIVIAWRGTKTFYDWIANIMDYMSPFAVGPDHVRSRVRVEAGFLHLYKSTNKHSRYCQDQSARDQVRHAIEKLVSKYKDEGQLSITVTGHSLGSALAILCAYDIAECQLDLPSSARTVPINWQSPESQDEVKCPGAGTSWHHCLKTSYAPPVSPEGDPDNKLTDRILVTVYSFGGPRVGNRDFAKRLNELGVKVLRVVNTHDKVTKVPGLIIHRAWNKSKIGMAGLSSYKHVGVKLKVDNELSDFLQKPAGLARAHCLEAYLHLVDSYQGLKESLRDPKPKDHINTCKTRMLRILPLRHKNVSKFWESKYNEYKKTFRDHALVNKHEDFLKPEFSIPPCWWQEENKGLVKNAAGEWGFPERDESIPGLDEAEEMNRSIAAACRKSGASYWNRCMIAISGFFN